MYGDKVEIVVSLVDSVNADVPLNILRQIVFVSHCFATACLQQRKGKEGWGDGNRDACTPQRTL